MIIPLANAIFEKKLKSKIFIIQSKKYWKFEFENVTYDFSFNKIKNKWIPISTIIYNAANEILVDQFLLKKIPFLGISKTIMRFIKIEI